MSWYSNILTNTTSRINNLQRTFLGGEADGDTEDDTHVCRVLRQHYTEKGRPFPGWLPPDPKAPPPVQPVLAQTSGVGSRYGGLTQQGGGGSLSSLWDNNPVQQPQDSQSLRRGRGAPPPMRGNDPRNNPLNPFNASGGGAAVAAGGGRDDVQARPLPSQRAGSYQSASLGGGSTQTPPAGAAGGSAQDRLRQRLWGGSRTASPAAGGPFQPPPQQKSGSTDDYESRFGPGGMYDAGGSGRGNDQPFMAANSPWASDESQMYGGGSSGRPAGLPGANRRGLPSGPRMR